jgi:tripartite ATP-independent transporter DctM subunit
MIPPSIGLILYGVLANASIGRLFVAGVIPGVMMCVALMLVVKVVAGRRGYVPSRATTATLAELLRAFRGAFWALLIPFGIIAGLRFGVFTPTEAGAAAAIYATLIGMFIYRELTVAKLPQVILETVLLTAVVMMIISAANAFGFYLAWQQLPMRAAELVLGISREPIVFLLAINLFLLLAGMFMDGAMLLILLTPLLMPMVQAYGIDPVHFGILLVLNIEIGAVTPPVGIVMYTATSIAGVKIEDFAREALPLYAALVAVLLLVTFIPELTLWLPGVVFG